MSGQRVGYIRVSSLDQNPDRQLDGVALDKVFTERASGKDPHRPELEALLGFVRPSSHTRWTAWPATSTTSAAWSGH